MWSWFRLLLLVAFCVATIHLYRGLRSVVSGQLQPIGATRRLVNWPARFCGGLLAVPLFAVIATGGHLAHELELSGDPAEYAATISENWEKMRAAKGDELVRKGAAKEIAAAITALLKIWGTELGLFGLLPSCVAWTWAAVAGKADSNGPPSPGAKKTPSNDAESGEAPSGGGL
jgi:hypothetical protein